MKISRPNKTPKDRSKASLAQQIFFKMQRLLLLYREKTKTNIILSSVLKRISNHLSRQTWFTDNTNASTLSR